MFRLPRTGRQVAGRRNGYWSPGKLFMLGRLYQIIVSLACTDLATGWTEFRALANKTQLAVSLVIHELRQDLPFPQLWLDSDNGSEFINDTIHRYCLSEEIAFTRSRPYQKKTTRHMSSRRTGLLCAIPSVMIALKALRNWPCWAPFMPIHAFISTSFSLCSS